MSLITRTADDGTVRTLTGVSISLDQVGEIAVEPEYDFGDADARGLESVFTVRASLEDLPDLIARLQSYLDAPEQYGDAAVV